MPQCVWKGIQVLYYTLSSVLLQTFPDCRSKNISSLLCRNGVSTSDVSDVSCFVVFIPSSVHALPEPRRWTSGAGNFDGGSSGGEELGWHFHATLFFVHIITVGYHDIVEAQEDITCCWYELICLFLMLTDCYWPNMRFFHILALKLNVFSLHLSTSSICVWYLATMRLSLLWEHCFDLERSRFAQYECWVVQTMFTARLWAVCNPWRCCFLGWHVFFGVRMQSNEHGLVTCSWFVEFF